jgi:ribose transport system substrate-binding protein
MPPDGTPRPIERSSVRRRGLLTPKSSHLLGIHRWRPITFAAVLALLISACGSTSPGSSSGSGPIKIALFGYGAANTYTQEVSVAAQAYAAAHGASVTFFDGKFDGPTQEHQIQDATTAGTYKGYLLLPNDIAGVVPVIKDAISKGIKVTTLHFQIGGQFIETTQVPGLTSCICASFTAGATAIANDVVRVCLTKDPCNVVNFYGNKNQSWEVPRRTAYNAVISQHSNIKLVAEPDAGFDQGKALTAMHDILQANPHIDVVSSPSADQMTLGAEKALRDANIAVGGSNGVVLIGNSSTYQGVAAVRAGDWDATYVHCPQTCEANIGVQNIIDAVNGKSVPPVTLEDGPLGPWARCGQDGLVNQAFLAKCPEFTGEYQG